MKIIYSIENKNNGRVYIGQASNKHRFSHHKYSLKKNKHANKQMQDDFNNGDSFEYKILCECENIEADEMERLHIKRNKDSYNVFSGGIKNFKCPIEFVNGMSERQKNKNLVGEKNSWSVISDDEAILILNDLKLRKRVNNIAKERNVSVYIVYNLLENKSYKHLMSKEREEIKNSLINEFDRHCEEAVNLFLSGMSQNQVSKKIGISRNTLRRILHEKGFDTKSYINQYKHANTEVTI